MKDEKWFKEACYQYSQTTESLVDFIERIYTHGRADQNEEVMDAVCNYIGNRFDEEDIFGVVQTIRAAGPEVGE